MKAKYKTPNNWKFDIRKHAWRNTQPSETVPNQSYTIEEILNKFTRGIDPMLTKNGTYEYEGDVSDDVLNENIDMLNGIEDIQEAEFMLKAIKERHEFLKAERKRLEDEKTAINSAG